MIEEFEERKRVYEYMFVCAWEHKGGDSKDTEKTTNAGMSY